MRQPLDEPLIESIDLSSPHWRDTRPRDAAWTFSLQQAMNTIPPFDGNPGSVAFFCRVVRSVLRIRPVSRMLADERVSFKISRPRCGRLYVPHEPFYISRKSTRRHYDEVYADYWRNSRSSNKKAGKVSGVMNSA